MWGHKWRPQVILIYVFVGKRVKIGPVKPRSLYCALAVFLSLSAQQVHAAQGSIDPNLRVAIQRANQNVVLSWFAANGLQYQLESSSNLVSWSNLSSVI